jgi:hypothetical protein
LGTFLLIFFLVGGAFLVTLAFLDLAFFTREIRSRRGCRHGGIGAVVIKRMIK